MEQLHSMRKSLAHSKLTSHAVGPSDLRPLNDLLASEKVGSLAVVPGFACLFVLSCSFRRSSIRMWSSI